MRGDLAGRPTADVIVIYLTGIVGLVLILTSLTGLVIRLHGDSDTSDLWTFEGEVIKSFTAIIIGYLAGRGVSSKNGGS